MSLKDDEMNVATAFYVVNETWENIKKLRAYVKRVLKQEKYKIYDGKGNNYDMKGGIANNFWDIYCKKSSDANPLKLYAFNIFIPVDGTRPFVSMLLCVCRNDFKEISYATCNTLREASPSVPIGNMENFKNSAFNISEPNLLTKCGLSQIYGVSWSLMETTRDGIEKHLLEIIQFLDER